ncbi:MULTISPECIES: hypothetical protein [Actinomycetes]|uniref:hypothetical protein n=1 Tax=Actinomycetes TaxID=1760 RepID=UPI0004C1F327|nr:MULTISPECIES: hypothetical protein [Actinomycetes]
MDLKPNMLSCQVSSLGAQLIALAMTCAAHEANLPEDSWRSGHEYFRSIGEARTRYLQFLTEAFGYVLADIERVSSGT